MFQRVSEAFLGTHGELQEGPVRASGALRDISKGLRHFQEVSEDIGGISGGL